MIAATAEVKNFAVGAKRNAMYSEEATNRLAEFMLSLPDPDDTLKQAGLTRADLRRLEKDDEVTQCLDKRMEAVVGTPWRLEPGNSRNAKWLAEEIAPHIHDLMKSAMDAIWYGYSVQEVVYAKKGGKIGIDFVAIKPFEWFFFAPDGSLRYRPNDGSAGIEGLPCDPVKYLLTRADASYRNPYGEALLSRLWWPVYFRAQLWRFRMQYLERFGMPITVGKTQGDRAEFANTLSLLASNASIAIGDMDDVSFVETATSGEAFSAAEAELCARIQKLILGQTLTSSVGKSGSYAAAKVHQDVMQDKRNADIRLVTKTVQYFINNLSHLNGFDAPLFVMADDTGLERERAERDVLLVNAGVLKLTEEYLLERYDYEAGDFELVAEQPEPEATEPEGDTVNPEMSVKMMTFAKRKQQFTPQQQAIEDAADDLMRKVPEPINLEAMLSAVKAATDPADLAVRLSLLLDQQDPRFTELLARAQFAAQTLGYVVAEQEAPQPKTQVLEAVPMAMTPPINLSITAPITMAAPEPQTVNVKLEAQPVQINVQPTPVQVDVNVAAPAVSITNDVQPASVDLTLPPRKTVTEIERDIHGDITRATQTEISE